MQRRWELKRRIVPLCLLILVSFSLGQPSLECSPSNVSYDWERWDYYELLGLKQQRQQQHKEGKGLDSKDIRKAYRKQAQIWHPDKASNQQNSTFSLEECTSRFARIAEAYEVLNNPPKRQEYDLFLRYCGELKEKKGDQSFHWSSLFESLVDPIRVFEEFFFGPLEKDDEEEMIELLRFSESSFGSTKAKEQQQPPVRVYTRQDAVHDPFSREEIIRISQTEEFEPDSKSGKFYYRIISQEFTKKFDPYTGVNLQPINQPYLREEGYRRVSHREMNEETESSPSRSFLFPGDILTPHSTPLVSPNKRYYAGLSPECELLVMAENRFGGDDDFIWSSETYGKDCFVTLKGPHLVIAMGKPEYPHQILWYSDAEGEANNMHTSSGLFQRPTFTYLAQLDNDGSLVVYKVWIEARQPQAIPNKALAVTRNFLLGNTRAEYDVAYSSTNSIAYKRCIYATASSGCFRLARRFYEASLNIYYTLKDIVARVDNAFDIWMDLILEEDDFVRALKESVWNGAAVGSHLASKSARLVRKVLAVVLSIREN